MEQMMPSLENRGSHHRALAWLRDGQLAVVLFALLATVYLLTFRGEFSSIDELAMYAATESLAQVHGLSTPQVSFARFHNPVGRIEPGQSLAATPLYLLAQQFAQVNNIHAVLLLNVLVTALTGATLFIILRRLRYRPTSAFLATLGYGLATTAWPYSRSLLREPLIALMWSLATLGLILWRQTGRWWHLVLCLLSLVLALVTKVSAVVAIPAFVLAGALGVPRSQRKRAWTLLGTAGVVALGAGAGIVIWRFGSLVSIANYTIRYPFKSALVRTYGQLFSPAKGLLFFSPVLLVAALGWPELARRDRDVVVLTAGAMAGILYLYGNNEMWYGGLAWGPRFLVPLLPLITIPLASVLSSRHLAMRILGVAGSAFGTLLQLPVAIATWEHAVEQLPLPLDPKLPWYDLRLWQRSPPLFQAFHWRPEWLNLLWWHSMADGSLARDLPLAVALGLALIAVLSMAVWSLWGHPMSQRALVASAVVAAMLVIIGGGTLLWRGYDLTRDYPGLSIAEAREIAAVVSDPGPGSLATTLVSVSNEFHIYFWLGLLKGHSVHHWISPGQTGGFEGVLQGRRPSRSIWLVVDRVHLQPDHSGHDAEYWLNRHTYQASGRWVGGFEVFRYALPEAPLAREPVGCSWSDQIALRSLARSTDQVRPGQDLLFDLEFERIGAISKDYILFLHLFADDGKILGRDGQPQYGGAPTTTWKQGERIVDRRAIAVPADAAPGEYTIVAGFVDPTSGERVLACCAGGLTGDHVELGKMRVGEVGR